jgi:hypothetical protein
MSRVQALTVAAALTWSAGCAHPDPAGRMAVWQLRGAVVSVERGELRVRHKSGQIVDLLVDDETVVLHGSQPADPGAVHAGARVVVEVEPLGGGRQRARRVHLSGGA